MNGGILSILLVNKFFEGGGTYTVLLTVEQVEKIIVYMPMLWSDADSGMVAGSVPKYELRFAFANGICHYVQMPMYAAIYNSSTVSGTWLVSHQVALVRLLESHVK